MRLAMRALQIISYFTAAIEGLMFCLALIYGGDVDLAYGPSENPFVIRAQVAELYGTFQFWPYVYFSVVGVATVYAFFRLGRLMGLFLRQEYFTQPAVNHMRFIAATYALLSFVEFVRDRWEIYTSGDHADLSKFSGEGVFAFMLSLTFLIIAHILNEARKNRDELEQYF